MTFTLGRAPEKLRVVVSADGDFISGIRRADGTDWPVGTSLILDFGGTEWPSVNTADLALWSVDAAQVDALIAARPRRAQLWFVDGETRLLWASGSLVEKD